MRFVLSHPWQYAMHKLYLLCKHSASLIFAPFNISFPDDRVMLEITICRSDRMFFLTGKKRWLYIGCEQRIIVHFQVPYFLERAPGALIKKSDFFGGRFFEGGALSRGCANLKVGLFWGALFRGGHLIYSFWVYCRGWTFSKISKCCVNVIIY